MRPSDTFINGIHEKTKFKNTQNHISSVRSSNISNFGNLGLGLAGLAYNIFGNERANAQQEYWNRLGQSNFENQFQIASTDLQKAGFNPSAILGGASQNSAPSASTASQNSIDVPAMLSAVTESKLANSQIELNKSIAEKNEAETEHTIGDYGFRSSEADKQRVWESAEREAREAWQSYENKEQRSHEWKTGERERLFLKWQTEYNAWWKQNEGVYERNLQRQLHNSSLQAQRVFGKMQYEADMAKLDVAHKYNIKESQVDASLHYVVNEMLNDKQFIRDFALKKSEFAQQEKLFDKWFEAKFVLQERAQSYQRSSDYRRGIINLANGILSLGASGQLSFENEDNPIGFKP